MMIHAGEEIQKIHQAEVNWEHLHRRTGGDDAKKKSMKDVDVWGLHRGRGPSKENSKGTAKKGLENSAWHIGGTQRLKKKKKWINKPG